jgi:YHS domain-containing protein
MRDLSRRNAVRLVLLAATSAFAASIPSVAAERAPLAIKGYDPVAYFTLGAPVRGVPQIEYEWDEQRYRFSRPEHRELFKADPVRYAPQFANLCAMALTRGEIVEANPEYWLISEGKLYIFGEQAGPKRFTQNWAQNVVKANRNRPPAAKR